ncbi:unnamed protein product [Trichobilharzia szidati]|nr:unnamed protein product [Trichobilharzia szidati]
MGSPLGPILADIFMGYLEQTRLSDTINGTTYYHRYVDATFVVCNDMSQASVLFDRLNEVHPNIKFTMEYEHNDEFNFLDLSVKRRDDGTVEKSIYREETWTGQYLHYNSFCPMSYKRGLVRTLYDRARKLCSPNKIEEEFSFVEKYLKENGYPKGFILQYSKERDEKEKYPTFEKKEVFICLPYKGETVSQKIEKKDERSNQEMLPCSQSSDTIQYYMLYKPIETG